MLCCKKDKRRFLEDVTLFSGYAARPTSVKCREREISDSERSRPMDCLLETARSIHYVQLCLRAVLIRGKNDKERSSMTLKNDQFI